MCVFRKYCFFIVCVCVFAFFSFRSPVVGADTFEYVQFYLGHSKSYNDDEREIEPLLIIYNNILRHISRTSLFYLFANTLLSLAPVCYLINRYSKDKILSVIIFFISGLYIIYCVSLRQNLSTSLLLLGMIFYVEKSIGMLKKWLVWISFSLCAYFMHTSAAFVSILMSIVFLINIKNKSILYFLVLFSFLFGYLLKDSSSTMILSFLFDFEISGVERLQSYSEQSDYVSEIFILTLLLPNIMAMVYIYVSSSSVLNSVISKFYLLGICMENIFMYFPFCSRMNALFLLFQPIALTFPICQNLIVDNGTSRLRLFRLYRYFLIVFVIYFSLRTLKSFINPDFSSLDKMHPYYFFYEK